MAEITYANRAQSNILRIPQNHCQAAKKVSKSLPSCKVVSLKSLSAHVHNKLEKGINTCDSVPDIDTDKSDDDFESVCNHLYIQNSKEELIKMTEANTFTRSETPEHHEEKNNDNIAQVYVIGSYHTVDNQLKSINDNLHFSRKKYIRIRIEQSQFHKQILSDQRTDNSEGAFTDSESDEDFDSVMSYLYLDDEQSQENSENMSKNHNEQQEPDEIKDKTDETQMDETYLSYDTTLNEHFSKNEEAMETSPKHDETNIDPVSIVALVNELARKITENLQDLSSRMTNTREISDD